MNPQSNNIEWTLSNINFSKDLSATITNDINDLTEKLKNIKAKNDEKEILNADKINEEKENKSLRIRILESQERLYQEQISQLNNYEIDSKPKSLDEVMLSTDIELVTVVNQMKEYKPYLERSLRESVTELAYEIRIIEHIEAIEILLHQTNDKYLKTQDNMKIEAITLKNKLKEQEELLNYFLENYSPNLYPKNMEYKSENLRIVLKFLLKEHMANKEKYVTVGEIAEKLEQNIDLEIQVLRDCSLIESEPKQKQIEIEKEKEKGKKKENENEEEKKRNELIRMVHI